MTRNRSVSVVLLMVSLICFLGSAGQSFADLKTCDRYGDCLYALVNQTNQECGYRGGAGGVVSSSCGQPPCQSGAVAQHNCFVDGCDSGDVKTCINVPFEFMQPEFARLRGCGDRYVQLNYGSASAIAQFKPNRNALAPTECARATGKRGPCSPQSCAPVN